MFEIFVSTMVKLPKNRPKPVEFVNFACRKWQKSLEANFKMDSSGKRGR